MSPMLASPERIEEMYRQAYRFAPGSYERMVARDNARQGLKTCEWCLMGFRPHRDLDPDGRVRRRGSGRRFCGVTCRNAWFGGWLRHHVASRLRPTPTPEEVIAEMRGALDALRAGVERGAVTP